MNEEGPNANILVTFVLSLSVTFSSFKPINDIHHQVGSGTKHKIASANNEDSERTRIAELTSSPVNEGRYGNNLFDDLIFNSFLFEIASTSTAVNEGTSVSAAAVSEATQTFPQDPTTSPSNLSPLHREHWRAMRTRQSHGNRVQDWYNCRLNSTDMSQLVQYVEDIFRDQSTLFRLNLSFGSFCSTMRGNISGTTIIRLRSETLGISNNFARYCKAWMFSNGQDNNVPTQNGWSRT